MTREVPVRDAATVMLVDDRPELEVLMLRRRRGSAFVGGMSVFPGGAVDPGDAGPELEAACPELGDAAASARLGLAQGGLAYWIAAIRECFEEAGVLLARDAHGRAPDLEASGAAERFHAYRAQVESGALALAELARREGLALAPEAMRYVARWITPPGPPRRYDTRFFVAAMPAGQTPLHDDNEAVHSEWLRPADALARFAAGELSMLPPTVGMLRILADFDSAQAVLAAAARCEAGPDRPARLAGEGGQWTLLLPGDAGYEAASGGAMRAWVRLRADGGR